MKSKRKQKLVEYLIDEFGDKEIEYLDVRQTPKCTFVDLRELDFGNQVVVCLDGMTAKSIFQSSHTVSGDILQHSHHATRIDNSSQIADSISNKMQLACTIYNEKQVIKTPEANVVFKVNKEEEKAISNLLKEMRK